MNARFYHFRVMTLSLWNCLPKTSTAPFCPSEVRVTVPVPPGASLWTRFQRYSGIGFLIAVGYMDPGNWATDIEAGSRFGYGLLGIVLLSSLVAMFLQTLCVRLGVASGRDLAQLCRERFHPRWNAMLWFFAQVAIVACDFAEVLGTALALKLLFHLPLTIGITLTALDTFIVLLLQGKGVLRVEHIVTGLVIIIAAAFTLEIAMTGPDWKQVALHMVPAPSLFHDMQAWVVSIGIIGATVMPHNLYLHSSAVGSRRIQPQEEARTDAIRLLTLDTIATLCLAFLVNAAILIVAAGNFHFHGYREVTEISDAYRLLAPMLGTTLAGVVFALALFASGQSSTFTGTIAGQVILQGFLNLRIPCWQQRLITRALAVIPAWLCVSAWGEGMLGKLLVTSQVVLSMQLPFAIVPLIMFCGNASIMGRWKISAMQRCVGWAVCLIIIAANLFLIYQLMAG